MSGPSQAPRKPTFARRSSYTGLPCTIETATPKPAPPSHHQSDTSATALQGKSVVAAPSLHVGNSEEAAERPLMRSHALPIVTKRPLLSKRPGAQNAAPKKVPRPAKRGVVSRMPSIPEGGSQASQAASVPHHIMVGQANPAVRPPGDPTSMSHAVVASRSMGAEATKSASAGFGPRSLSNAPRPGAAIATTGHTTAVSNTLANMPAADSAARGPQLEAAAKPVAKQRVKASDLAAAEVNAKVAEKCAAGKLADLTVPEAKCWLKDRKLPLKGKKDELIARIQENMAMDAGKA